LAELEAKLAKAVDKAEPEAEPELEAQPEAEPEPVRRVLALVSPQDAPTGRLRAHSAIDRAERVEAERKLGEAVDRLLGALEVRRVEVFELAREPRTRFPETARTAAAKALTDRASRAAGWAAALACAVALDRAGELDATLERRFRELRRAHAYMLEGPENQRYILRSDRYPQPIGSAPDFVVILREADQVIEAADAWVTAQDAAEGLSPAAQRAWSGLVSAQRQRKTARLPADAVRALHEVWLTDNGDGDVRAEAYRTFRPVLMSQPMDPFAPSTWHREQWGQHWRQALERLGGDPDVALPTQQAAR
jgi:hypothetical protein